MEPSHLCEECEKILLRPWSPALRCHKSSFHALRQSAFAGCSFCAILERFAISRLEADTGRTLDEVDRSGKTNRSLEVPAAEHCNLDMHEARADDEDTQDFGPIDELTYTINLPPRPMSLDRYDSFIQFEARIALVSGQNRCIGGSVVPLYPDLAICRQWIKWCQSDHVACRHQTGTIAHNLPSRVIDVGSPDGSQAPRLVEGKGRTDDYVCLSHCWGGQAIDTTTSKNLAARLAAINVKTLPPTFQDAIVATRALGYRYCWIDALCIVQDDKAEWSRECPQMVSIFRGSSVTLAASRSEHPFETFLGPRVTYYDATQNLRLSSPNNDIDCVISISLYNKYANPHRRFEECNLTSRAWTLQETVLPPRVVHFGAQQMYFECNVSRACESFVRTPFKLHIWDSLVLENIYDLQKADSWDYWELTVSRYSRRALTYGDDKLPALSGLAAFVQKVTEDRYCAGLWRSNLLDGLQWQLDKDAEEFGHRSKVKANFSGPSWSWVSCDYPITYQRLVLLEQFNAGRTFSSSECTCLYRLEIRDVQMDYVGSDDLGQVSGGRIELFGRVQAVRVGRKDPNYHSHYPAPIYAEGPAAHRIANAMMDSKAHERLKVEEDEDFRTATKAFCLLLFHGHIESTEYGWIGVWTGLICDRTPGSKNTFRRIGFAQDDCLVAFDGSKNAPAELSNVASWWDDVEPSTITLV